VAVRVRTDHWIHKINYWFANARCRNKQKDGKDKSVQKPGESPAIGILVHAVVLMFAKLIDRPKIYHVAISGHMLK
jgi:hypothetical protein